MCCAHQLDKSRHRGVSLCRLFFIYNFCPCTKVASWGTASFVRPRLSPYLPRAEVRQCGTDMLWVSPSKGHWIFKEQHTKKPFSDCNLEKCRITVDWRHWLFSVPSTLVRRKTCSGLIATAGFFYRLCSFNPLFNLSLIVIQCISSAFYFVLLYSLVWKCRSPYLKTKIV